MAKFVLSLVKKCCGKCEFEVRGCEWFDQTPRFIFIPHPVYDSFHPLCVIKLKWKQVLSFCRQEDFCFLFETATNL